jgi:ribosome biogenesis GTPase
MNEIEQTGLVIRTQSGFAWVYTQTGVFICRLRGKLKQHHKLSDIISVGDRVRITLSSNTEGQVEEVEPRNRVLSRMAPEARGAREQVLVANPDQVLLVFACANPAPHLRMIDRFLIILEKQQIPSRIVVNKIDLVKRDEIEAMFSLYENLGFAVDYVSTVNGEGVEELRKELHDKISVMAGPSGVGKTSLLNALQPGLGGQVREVSRVKAKGMHTTQVRELFPLDAGAGWLTCPESKPSDCGIFNRKTWMDISENLKILYRTASSMIARITTNRDVPSAKRLMRAGYTRTGMTPTCACGLVI